MNNILEQDHRYVKKRVLASQWFRSVNGALNTIAGYEAMNIIRKGQIRWLSKTDTVGQIRFIERTLGLAAHSGLPSQATCRCAGAFSTLPYFRRMAGCDTTGFPIPEAQLDAVRHQTLRFSGRERAK
jgi:hypothetical protein